MCDKYEVTISSVKELEQGTARVSGTLLEEVAVEQGNEWSAPRTALAGESRHREWPCKGPEAAADYDFRSTQDSSEAPEN